MREQRQQIGLTQAQLANELGVQPNTVTRWENGVLVVPKIAELAMEALLHRGQQKAVKKKTSKKGQ